MIGDQRAVFQNSHVVEAHSRGGGAGGVNNAVEEGEVGESWM